MKIISIYGIKGTLTLLLGFGNITFVTKIILTLLVFVALIFKLDMLKVNALRVLSVVIVL